MTGGGMRMRISHGTGAPPSVLGRVVAILDAFDADTPTLTLAELAARTRLPKATAHRLAGDLTARRLLERTDGRFRLGPRLTELGGLVHGAPDLRNVALPFLEDLAQATGEAVKLAVLDGGAVVTAASVPGTARPAADDGRVPAHASAAGKAILACSPPEVLAQVLAAGVARLTPFTVVSPDLLREQLGEIARRGVAVDREESHPGVAAVASPVVGAGGRAVAAIALTGRMPHIDPDRLGPAVRTAALALSRQLARGVDGRHPTAAPVRAATT